MKDERRRVGLWRGVCMVVCVVVCMGCGSRYVPVHYYHERESVRVERDSVHFADTVRIAERGDTVLVEVVKWRTRYRSATDTVVRVDTVAIPRELMVQPASERQPWWRMWLTAIGALVVVGAGAIGVYKLVRVLR
jgi:hypothetical protein